MGKKELELRFFERLSSFSKSDFTLRHVVQVFPSRRSLIRMMGAVFVEMDEDWASRRWFTEGAIAMAMEGRGCRSPAPGYAGSAEGHARRIMSLVVADNPVGGRAA